MHDTIIGNGEKKLLIVHGWMESGTIYRQLADDLQDIFTTTLVDLPGFGRSAPPESTNIIEAYTADIIALINRGAFDVIVGHSAGGTILIRALNDHTLNYHNHVILANPEYLGIPHLKPIAWARRLNQLLLSIQHNLPLSIARPLLKFFGRLSVKDMRTFTEQLVIDCHRADPYTSAKLGKELVFDTFVWKTDRALKSITVLISEYDRIVSNQHLGQLIITIPACQSVLFKGIGHMIVLEDYDGFLAQIKRTIQ